MTPANLIEAAFVALFVGGGLVQVACVLAGWFKWATR